MEFQINFWFSISNQKLKIDLRFNTQTQTKNGKSIYFSIFNFELNTKIEFQLLIIFKFWSLIMTNGLKAQIQ